MLTTKASRAEEMRLAPQQFVVGPLNTPNGLFLFAAQSAECPLELPLLDVRGAIVRLMGWVEH